MGFNIQANVLFRSDSYLCYDEKKNNHFPWCPRYKPLKNLESHRTHCWMLLLMFFLFSKSYLCLKCTLLCLTAKKLDKDHVDSKSKQANFKYGTLDINGVVRVYQVRRNVTSHCQKNNEIRAKKRQWKIFRGILRSWTSQKSKLYPSPTMNGITTTTFAIIWHTLRWHPCCNWIWNFCLRVGCHFKMPSGSYKKFPTYLFEKHS